MKKYWYQWMIIIIQIFLFLLILPINNTKILKFIIIALYLCVIVSLEIGLARNHKRKYLIKNEKIKKNLAYHFYNLAKENNEKLIKLKHDLKNQLQVAYVIFEKDKKEAIKILDKIDENIETINSKDYCKNPILNTIIAIKVVEARKSHIKVNIRIDNSVDLKMEEIDICNIFANLLDNSIEASKESTEKYINIFINKRNNYTIIKCENSYHSKLKRDRKLKFRSTKQDNKNHGYGLKIIETTVEKYNGEMNIQVTDKIFKVIIILN